MAGWATGTPSGSLRDRKVSEDKQHAQEGLWAWLGLHQHGGGVEEHLKSHSHDFTSLAVLQPGALGHLSLFFSSPLHCCNIRPGPLSC